MRMRRVVLSFAAGSLFTLVPRLPAQTVNVNTSTGAPGTVYHGSSIDDVNLSSGNLRISIPLLHMPGRGIDTDIVLTYGSKVWETTTKVLPDGSGTVEHIAAVSGDAPKSPSVGWFVGFPRTVIAGKNWQACVLPVSSGCSAAYFYKDYVLADGSRITMVSDTTNSTASYHSFDGTYVRQNSAGLFFKDGVRLPSITGRVIEDTNGNFISAATAGSVVTYTDTVGRAINYNYSAATGGVLQSITYKDSSGTTQTISFTYQSYTLSFPWVIDEFGACDGSGVPDCGINQTETDQLLTRVTLPNGLSYQFQYNLNADGTTTGEVSRLSLPTGGYVRYQYGFTNELSNPSSEDGQNRSLTQRIVSSDGTSASEKTWTYTIQNASCLWNGAPPVSLMTDPLGNSQAQTQAVGIPLPTKIEFKNPSGTTIKTINQAVGFDTSAFSDPVGNASCNPSNLSNPRVTSRITVLNDANLQSKEVLTYGSVGNVTRRDEYDLGSGAPGPLLRYTTYTYLHDSSSTYAGTSVNILNRVTSEVTCNPGGTFCAQTNTTYDGATPTATSSVAQHDYTNFPSTYNLRGNATQISRQLNTNNSWLTSTNAFNDAGNLLQTTDPGGHTTSFSYADNYYSFTPASPTSAFVTQTTRPVTNGVNHVSRAQFYFNSGLQAAACGENFPGSTSCAFGLSAQSDYASFTYDLLNRPKTRTRPDGGQTTLTYNEAALPISVASSSSINPSLQQVRTSIYDGLGRLSQSQLNSDPQGAILVDTTYDALGRVSTVSNPYRTGTDSTTSAGTTTYAYDALGRKISETYPDGSVPTTAYCGASTLVKDPTGKWRRSRTDGLGRLVEVDEPNAPGASVAATGCPGTGEPIWVTSYSYDALGNLTSVLQNGSRSRSFTFDSLSRLITSTNPEVGTITYGYNSDGVLVSKTDARNITTNYNPTGNPIDALHRITGITYSNSDPSLTFTYDQTNCLGLTACQNIGQRTGMTDAAGSESWAYQIDATNSRSLHKEQRTTNGVTKSTTYVVNLAGNTTQVTYPTGRVVNYTFDGANRPSTAADGSNGITYATDFQTPPSGSTCLAGKVCYTPQGTFYALSIGQSAAFTGLNLRHTYNTRLQPSEFSASSSAGNAIDISYNFVDPATLKNAGHVYGITNNLDGTRSQNFTYDQLNRITGAQTTSTFATSPGHCWSEVYNVDPWANLQSIAATSNSAYVGCSQESGFTKTPDTSNHLSGLSYDAGGNTTNDGVNTYTWNAESQMSTGGGVTYAYDGEGRRTQKSNGKLYWYGSGGEILAETDAPGNTQNEYIFFGGQRIAIIPAGGNPSYYVEDLLGTSRVITQSNGAVCYDADFYPFGGERSYTNTCPQNYKFEGKERDTETGNDDFGARYYSNRFGRWLSADWSAVPAPVPYANLSNPQTLNLYAMVSDDPESFADLDGHFTHFVTQGDTLAESRETNDSHTKVQCGVGDAGCETQQNEQNKAQNKSPGTMSSWQFFKEEVGGVYDTTAGPIVHAVEHPIETVKNTISDFVEGVERVAKNPKVTLMTAASEAKDQALNFAKDVGSGKPRAIGQAAGLVIDTFIAVRGVQGAEIKIGDNLRIAPTGNRTGHPVGRFPHYHRRIVGPNGKPVPGGSMRWHRPWEKGW